MGQWPFRVASPLSFIGQRMVCPGSWREPGKARSYPGGSEGQVSWDLGWGDDVAKVQLEPQNSKELGCRCFWNSELGCMVGAPSV